MMDPESCLAFAAQPQSVEPFGGQDLMGASTKGNCASGQLGTVFDPIVVEHKAMNRYAPSHSDEGRIKSVP
jgi:hypothetical protein